jgi:hypothetical protein
LLVNITLLKDFFHQQGLNVPDSQTQAEQMGAFFIATSVRAIENFPWLIV